MFTKEDLIRKISALLATAESFAEEGNDEAAASYVAKAHTLQQNHSIESYMLNDAAHRPEEIVSKKIILPGAWGRRKVVLAHQVALKTDCTGYYGKGWSDNAVKSHYTYTVFGFESDVDWVETLITSLCHQADEGLRYALKDKGSWVDGRSFAASFHLGFASEIGQRLALAKREANRQAQEAAGDVVAFVTSTSVSLAVVAKQKQVKDEMTARVGRLGKGSSVTTSSGSGYSAGRSAGARASLARGSVGSSARGSLSR